MGNSPSTAAQPPQQPSASAQAAAAVAAAAKSRPQKTTKKRSIVDHPALLNSVPSAPAPAAASPVPAARQAPSSPIPIPVLPGQPAAAPRPTPRDDSFLLDLPQPQPHPPGAEVSTHRPLQYNSTRSFGVVRRGGVQGGGMWGTPQRPAPAPPAPAFVPEYVQSSIPLRLRAPNSPPGGADADAETSAVAREGARPVPTHIVWRGGGREILVAGTFNATEWRARERMRYDAATGTHVLTLHLTPGTYRLKFIVDDTWRCSDDMPTAVDGDTGNLVNYIDIEEPLAATSPCSDPPPASRGGNCRRAPFPVRTAKPLHPPPPPQLAPSDSAFWGEPDADGELEALGWEHGRDGVLEHWTGEVPTPLYEAARQEEAYVAALQAQRASRRNNNHPTTPPPFPPRTGIPVIPPAPRLPRHLDKVILNARSGGESASKHRGGSARSRSRLGMTALLAPPALNSGSGSGGAASSSRGGGGGLSGMDEWASADDSSVLPVPNHAVLHHLGTSAIKNGVLAVSDTTRYNKKYITTIYYKPA